MMVESGCGGGSSGEENDQNVFTSGARRAAPSTIRQMDSFIGRSNPCAHTDHFRFCRRHQGEDCVKTYKQLQYSSFDP